MSISIAKQIGQAESILDVGCGDGNNATRIAKLIGAKMLEGVHVVVRPNASIAVKAYDGLHLPFDDKSSEAVTIIDVLHN